MLKDRYVVMKGMNTAEIEHVVSQSDSLIELTLAIIACENPIAVSDIYQEETILDVMGVFFKNAPNEVPKYIMKVEGIVDTNTDIDTNAYTNDSTKEECKAVEKNSMMDVYQIESRVASLIDALDLNELENTEACIVLRKDHSVAYRLDRSDSSISGDAMAKVRLKDVSEHSLILLAKRTGKQTPMLTDMFAKHALDILLNRAKESTSRDDSSTAEDESLSEEKSNLMSDTARHVEPETAPMHTNAESIGDQKKEVSVGRNTTSTLVPNVLFAITAGLTILHYGTMSNIAHAVGRALGLLFIPTIFLIIYNINKGDLTKKISVFITLLFFALIFSSDSVLKTASNNVPSSDPNPLQKNEQESKPSTFKLSENQVVSDNTREDKTRYDGLKEAQSNFDAEKTATYYQAYKGELAESRKLSEMRANIRRSFIGQGFVEQSDDSILAGNFRLLQTERFGSEVEIVTLKEETISKITLDLFGQKGRIMCTSMNNSVQPFAVTKIQFMCPDNNQLMNLGKINNYEIKAEKR